MRNTIGVPRFWVLLGFFIGYLGQAQADEAKPGAPGSAPGGTEAVQAKKAPVVSTPAYQMKVWSAVNASGSAIDQCTDRYSGEFPDRKGKADIQWDVGPEGRLGGVKVNCSLQASEKLVTCLKDVARKWSFPPVPDESYKSGISIHIYKGSKFVLLKPGQKPEPPKPGQPAPDGFMPFDIVFTGLRE